MFVLNCKIEFEGGKRWTLTQVCGVKIVRDANSMMDWCEIELPGKMRWDTKRECPLQCRDKVKVYLGYDGKLELAFKGYVTKVYDLGGLRIFCGNEMFMLKEKVMNRGTHNVTSFNEFMRALVKDTNIRIDESISIGEIYENGITLGSFFDNLYKRYQIRTYFILNDEEETLCFGVIRNNKIKAVYDIEKNVIKNNLTLNKPTCQGLEIMCVSVSRTNEKITSTRYVDVPPFKKVVFRYRELTQQQLDKEVFRRAVELYNTKYTGNILVFGGNLVEKYDLIGIKENGEKRGLYEVAKNVITFGQNGFRQQITLGNERQQ